MDSLVSIIITTYGGKDCLLDAIESCIKQSYKNLEILVVDDNGRETVGQIKTEELLKSYIKTKKISYIVHEKNSNASAARNTGFRYSKGEYIALLDDDDIFCEDKIKNQIEAFSKLDDDYELVYTSMLDIVEGGKTFEYRALSKGFCLYKFLMMKVSACTSNIMMSRSLYERLGGFDETFRRHQDWEFLARAASETKFCGIPYVGTVKHTKNIIRRYNAQSAEAFRFKYIEKLKQIIKVLPEREQKYILAHEYNEIAKLYMREHNWGKVIEYIKLSKMPGMLLMALIKKPFKNIGEKVQMKKNDKIIVAG